jgi:hypothetical protein
MKLIQSLCCSALINPFIPWLKFSTLIKKGYLSSKIGIPTLALILLIIASSFLLIPLMDYWRETALLDGMPVML